MAQEEEKISRSRKKQLLARLKEQIQPKKSLIYLAAFLSWIQFLTRITSFALIAQALTEFYEGKQLDLYTLFLYLLALNGLGFGIALFAKQFQGIASQFARNKLKREFFQAFVAKDGEFQDSRTAADILTVAAQGIDSLDTYYSYYLSLNLRTCFNCLTVLIIVFWLFPLGGLIFILALPFIPVSIILMQKRSRRIMNRYWGSYMDVGNLFLDDLKGLNTLYSYQADKKYEQEFAEQAEDFRDATMELLGFQLQSVGYMDAVMYLGIGLSGFLALSWLAAGKLSLFSMIYFVLIATEFFTPIREAGYGMHLVMMNTKMADRIFSFLDSVQETKVETKQDLAPFQHLSVQDLSFSHGDKKILNRVSFDIEVGQVFAIAGESGRGKTTLAKILLGKLEPEQGQIFFGKTSNENLAQSALYKEIMYVSSNSFLLNASILENLQLARDWSRDKIQQWLTEKKLLSFIENLPEGLDTLVGEDGNLLSPGQRQQVICARAILAQKSLYIFDEITSSVDKDNEDLIYELLNVLSKEALVIEITHKMKRVAEADQVLFMSKEGTVLASPIQLYWENQDYRTLVDRQRELEERIHGS
jgi:ATP-binding cassette subfamily C protein